MQLQTPVLDAFSSSAAIGPELQSVLKTKPQIYRVAWEGFFFSFFALLLILPNILFSFLLSTDHCLKVFMRPSVITSRSFSFMKNAHSEINTIHVRLTHITPICITLYLLTFYFGYKFFHSVSQSCKVSLQLSTVGIHFCDLNCVNKLSHLIVCLIF